MRKILAVVTFALISVTAFAADTVVAESHTTFDVDSAKIRTGETIVFSNRDDVTHDIHIQNPEGEVEDRGLQKPGEDIKATFPKPGEYKVRCIIHPKMKMVVTVQ